MAGSGFIRKPRCSTPKPSSKSKVPAKKQSKVAKIRFTQQELSRQPKPARVSKLKRN